LVSDWCIEESGSEGHAACTPVAISYRREYPVRYIHYVSGVPTLIESMRMIVVYITFIRASPGASQLLFRPIFVCRNLLGYSSVNQLYHTLVPVSIVGVRAHVALWLTDGTFTLGK
jgi:hypothetical protein